MELRTSQIFVKFAGVQTSVKITNNALKYMNLYEKNLIDRIYYFVSFLGL